MEHGSNTCALSTSIPIQPARWRLMHDSWAQQDEVRSLCKPSSGPNCSIPIQYDKAILNYLARHYKQAIAQLESLVQVEPEFPDARKSLSDAYARRGQWSKASIELLKWLAQIGVDGQEIRTTRRILQDHGFRELWQRNSRGNACHRSPDEYGMPFNRAVDSALLGDTEPAVNWLRRAYEQHDTRLLNLKVDPQFDKVPSDPRFSSLLQQIGFRL